LRGEFKEIIQRLVEASDEVNDKWIGKVLPTDSLDEALGKWGWSYEYNDWRFHGDAFRLTPFSYLIGLLEDGEWCMRGSSFLEDSGFILGGQLYVTSC
jgi:hypothetical protein